MPWSSWEIDPFYFAGGLCGQRAQDELNPTWRLAEIGVTIYIYGVLSPV